MLKIVHPSPPFFPWSMSIPQDSIKNSSKKFHAQQLTENSNFRSIFNNQIAKSTLNFYVYSIFFFYFTVRLKKIIFIPFSGIVLFIYMNFYPKMKLNYFYVYCCCIIIILWKTVWSALHVLYKQKAKGFMELCTAE